MSVIDNEGIYVADVNNNDWPDILAIGGTTPKLYRNYQGRYRPDTSFPVYEKKINSAAFVDYDMDGFRDLVLVPQKGSPKLLKNNAGTFHPAGSLESVSLSAGIGVVTGDFFPSECPDLLLLQYGPGYETGTLKQKRYRQGAKYRDLSRDNGRKNILVRGNYESFTPVDVPVFQRTHWSLGGSGVDVTGNGLMDIHVTNDFYRDSLYINRGNGSFEHTYLSRKTNRNGMSSQVTDFNRDGHPDLFVSNIYVPENTKLFDRRFFRTLVSVAPNGHNALINDGNGSFTDQAETLNLQRGG